MDGRNCKHGNKKCSIFNIWVVETVGLKKIGQV